MRGWVLGMSWRHNLREPACVQIGGGVTVEICLADRGDGPPEIVVVLRIPAPNLRVGDRDVGLCEEASAIGDIESDMLIQCHFPQLSCDLQLRVDQAIKES